MGEQQMVGYLQGSLPIASPRGMNTAVVAHERRHPRFVVGDPQLYPIGEPVEHDGGIIEVVLYGVSIGPAPLVLKALRQIPMIEGDHGCDFVGQQIVNQPLVEIKTGRIEFSAAGGKDTGPGDGEAGRSQTDILHQPDIFLVAVIVIAGYVCVLVLVHLPRGVAESIPDGLSSSILVHRALDLVGGGCSAPQEIFREIDFWHLDSTSENSMRIAAFLRVVCRNRKRPDDQTQ